MAKRSALDDLVSIMARLRSPEGCPWDREQDHNSLRWHAVEEAYELMDAIDSKDDKELEEELGDLLLQVVFHCQLGKERGAFNLEKVARHICDKLIRRHPHVFGDVKVNNVAQVWTNWEKIKRAEKHGTRHARESALDGIPKHLPALMRAEKLIKKAKRAQLSDSAKGGVKASRKELGRQILALVEQAQAKGWSAEDLLRAETQRQEKLWRKTELARQKKAAPSSLDKKPNSTKLRLK
jgi:uncharacterized protein YabN with tetrapyrrole methylase and pyrophosphatase domain